MTDLKHRLTLLFLVVTTHLFSCSVAVRSFCETVDTQHVVVKCVIIDSVFHGRRLQILDVIKGNENRDTVTVWNGTDFDCNGPWSLSAEYMGNIGDTLLAALTLLDSVQEPWQIVGDYVRSNNFGYTPELQFSNDTLFGLISGLAFGPSELAVWKLSYNDFINYWNVHSKTCFGLVGLTETGIESFYLYPNPVTDEIFFSQTPTGTAYTVYNMSGAKVKTGKVTGASLKLNELSAGLYFLDLYNNQLRKRFRFFKM